MNTCVIVGHSDLGIRLSSLNIHKFCPGSIASLMSFYSIRKALYRKWVIVILDIPTVENGALPLDYRFYYLGDVGRLRRSTSSRVPRLLSDLGRADSSIYMPPNGNRVQRRLPSLDRAVAPVMAKDGNWDSQSSDGLDYAGSRSC